MTVRLSCATVAAAAVAMVLSACATGSETTGSGEPARVTVSDPATDVRWFPTGPWWQPIAADAALDPLTPTVAALLTEPEANRVANLDSFAVPVVEWDDGAAAASLTVRQAEAWGINDLADIPLVRVPPGTAPAPGSDAKLVIIDRARDRVIDLLGTTSSDGSWSALWGGVYGLSGDGISRFPVHAIEGLDGQDPSRPVSRATGSGISSLAGLVTVADVRAGVIDHALVFATDRACGPPLAGPFRTPATTTDGWVTDAPCIPQGARLRLDPTIDLNALKLSDGQRMVAVALQRYGAFCIDNGGSRVGFIFERPTDADRAVYEGAGLVGDYASMNDIPWQHVQVVAGDATGVGS